jgi:hypothetical protein
MLLLLWATTIEAWPSQLRSGSAHGSFGTETGEPFSAFDDGGSPADSGRPVANGRGRCCRGASPAPKEPIETDCVASYSP